MQEDLVFFSFTPLSTKEAPTQNEQNSPIVCDGGLAGCPLTIIVRRHLQGIGSAEGTHAQGDLEKGRRKAMGKIDANNCSPGTKLLHGGELYSVVARAHHKPGKGGAFVKFKLKGIISGKVIDHTVRAGTKMEQADVTTEAMQYLYREGDNFVFMDMKTYEQLEITEELLGDAASFLTENTEAGVTMYEGKAIGVQLPQKMVFEVTDTIDNPAKGNTATNTTKEATLSTGLVVQVPLFIKIGDRVRLLTEDGSYLERA